MTPDAPRMEFAPFTRVDLPALLDLWVAAWTQAMPGIDFEARRMWFVGHLDGLHAQGFSTLCAYDANRALLGFVTLNVTSGELDQIAVLPRAAGQGVGHALLEQARMWSPAIITLTVNQDNARACAFYAREGFVVTGEGINSLSGLKTWRMEWCDTGDR